MTSQYQIVLHPEAVKDLLKLDKPVQLKAKSTIAKLKIDPTAGQTLHGRLKGFRSLEFTAQGGTYRAVYRIQEDTCVVFIIGAHENIYKQAERRVKQLKPR